MALSDRSARLVLGVLGGGLVLGALLTDIARRTDGEFWGDAATYHAMARSLAEDFDLRYEARDVFRVRREFKSGPQGLFLKRSSGGLRLDAADGFPWVSRVPREEPRLYYAKAFVYPLAAAPFVRLFGTRGLLLVNALVFTLALWLGYDERRRRGNDPLRALVFVLVVFLATVAPLYLLWPTPEVFGLGLAMAGFAATSLGRPWLAAVLFGVAVYLKPPNLFLALPLGVAPLLPAEGERLFGPHLRAGVLESLKRGALLGVTALALYGLNAVFTGEMNYQGGERKTFYGRFPLEEHDVTFDNSGFWMTTENLGPLVEGKDEDKQTARTGPLRAPEEVRASFLRNLGYFWVGRFGGVLPYFAPAFGAVVALLVLGPRTRRGWLAFASLAVSMLFYIWVIPDNWYGGGGTVGNRYFLSPCPSPSSSSLGAVCGRSWRSASWWAPRSWLPSWPLPSRTRSVPASTPPPASIASCPPSSRCSTTSRPSPSRGERRGRTASPGTPTGAVPPTRTPTSSTSWTTGRTARRPTERGRVFGSAKVPGRRSSCAHSTSSR
jgi:hypothetical protein